MGLLPLARIKGAEGEAESKASSFWYSAIKPRPRSVSGSAVAGGLRCGSDLELDGGEEGASRKVSVKRLA